MSELYLGLMSGSSLDGVDAALVEFAGNGQKTIGTCYLPYPEPLREEALALQAPGTDELHRTALLAQQLTQLYAAAVKEVLAHTGVSVSHVRAIGCHGQTLRHRPADGYTIQIGNPALLAELTGISVVADFRSRDIAAGGQGAPLVPAVHSALFGTPSRHRVLLNLGGIANVTDLHPNREVKGFDCGPANILLDAWINKHLGHRYDAEGQWAQQGRVIPPLLDTLRSHPFFGMPPPKSCGREEFNLEWLQEQLEGTERPEDVQATLLCLTSWSSAEAIRNWCGHPDELYVCGGGAHNLALLAQLSGELPDTRVTSTDALGVPPDWVEAIAFAWLARQHMKGLPGNLVEVTGARGPRILGALYPA